LEYPLLSLPVFLLLWLTVSVTVGCLSAVRVAAVGIEALTVIVEAPIESAAHSSLEELVLEYPLAARKEGVAIESSVNESAARRAPSKETAFSRLDRFPAYSGNKLPPSLA
jgi:hypothetical protein